MNLNRIQQDLLRLYGGRAQGARSGAQTPASGAGGASAADEAAAGGTRADDVVLSDAAGALRRAMGVARSAPDVREALVEGLRSQVQAGTYRVPDEALARRLAEALG